MNRIAPRAGRLLAALGLALAAGACGRRGGQAGGPPPVVVQTAVAVTADTPVVLATFGTTKDQASVDVVPQVSGRLAATYVADGAVVTNGQPLFLIDPSDYALRVRQAEGQVALTRAAQALSRLTVDRNRPLLAKQMIAQEQFDAFETRLAADTAQLAVYEAALDQARLDLSRCTVTATVAGACSRREVDTGNLVAANQTRLLNIRGYDPLFVDVTVSEQDLDLVRRALAAGPVRLDVCARGQTNWHTGRVVSLDNAVDARTGTLTLRGLVPNPDRALWARQFIEARVHAGVAAGAVMVPESAVQFGKDGPYAFVATPERRAELRPVQVGVRHDGRLQLRAGVAAGESVVVLGQLMLYPGAAVVEPPRAPAGTPPGGAPGTPGG